LALGCGNDPYDAMERAGYLIFEAAQCPLRSRIRGAQRKLAAEQVIEFVEA
jgi:hypothetical protein